MRSRSATMGSTAGVAREGGAACLRDGVVINELSERAAIVESRGFAPINRAPDMKLFANFLLAALMGVAASASLAADAPAAAATAPAAAKPAKPDPAKGDAVFNSAAQACASCHNADGNSAIAANPKLAQQHPEYILKQLQDFKSGKRKSPIMQPLAAKLSDEDMRNIAWFVGSKKIKTGFSKEKDTVALGEKIYRGGIADRQI